MESYEWTGTNGKSWRKINVSLADRRPITIGTISPNGVDRAIAESTDGSAQHDRDNLTNAFFIIYCENASLRGFQGFLIEWRRFPFFGSFFMPEQYHWDLLGEGIGAEFALRLRRG